MKKTEIVRHLIREDEISFKRIFNLIKNYFYLIARNPKPNGYPSILMIEPTNFCNLKCPLCPSGNNTLLRKRGFMDFDNYRKIIDELGDYLINLTLWNYGEPFLNKSIYEMIEYAKRKRIFVRVSTNGHFFNNKENIDKLIKTGLDNLIVSLDGASQKTFMIYRKKGNFDEVINNMKLVVKEKRKLNSKLPFIELQFIVMKQNEHEIPKMKMLAKDIGVDKLTLKTVNITMGAKEKDIKERKGYIPDLTEFSRYYDNNGKVIRKKIIRNKCTRLWLSSVINWDGSVNPCCYDSLGKYNLGNAFEKGFKSVWEDKKYVNFRKTIIKNKKNIPICYDCPGTFFGININ